MFAALKYHRAEAKLPYSEYCTYSAQQRYGDYDRFKKQMYKIHRPHLASGYLKTIRYEQTEDAAGAIDWMMYYAPGPKAKAEYQTFTRSGRIIDAPLETVGEEIATALLHSGKRRGSRQARLQFGAAEPPESGEPPLPILAEMMRRGISEAKARALLAASNPETILDQLEWGDRLVNAEPRRFRNPPGFYIHLVSEKVTPPEDFETSRRRKAREKARAAESMAQLRRYELEEAYRGYHADTIKGHIAAHVGAEDMERLVAEKTKERRKEQWCKNLPPQTIREIAERDVRLAIAAQIPIMSFEEFSRTRQGREGDAAVPPVQSA